LVSYVSILSETKITDIVVWHRN